VTASTATLISEAKAALAAADAADAQEIDARQLGSEARWLAAERMAQLSERMGRREIAAAVGLADSTVGYYVAAWKKGGHARGQVFSEVLKEVRGGWGHRPTSIEGKAKAAAEYIANPEVWKDPAVQKAATQAMRDHSRSALPPAPARPAAGLVAAETWERASYWMQLWGRIESLRREITRAITELDRSGLPHSEAGKLVKALRGLARDAAQAEEAFTETGIGRTS
jgi:hypothetical protein